MKKIIISIIIVIITYTLFVMSMAFLYASFDFRVWPEAARAVCVIFTPVVYGSAIAILYINEITGIKK